MPLKELRNIHKEVLHGVKRPAALQFNCPGTPLSDLHLDKYEVLTCEPLHDISHHIQNLFEELPSHVPSDIQAIIKNVYDGTLGNKELKRGCDYRKALIMLAAAMEGKASTPVMELITTLTEIQRICYLPADKRCQREILRLHNQAFLHTIRLREVITHQPKKLTSRCMYGIYFHALTTHAPMLYRIVPLSSTHAESEERIFNKLRGITRTTGSTRHPGQIIGNILVRAHCEGVLHASKDAAQYQQSSVSKAARAQEKDGGDTIISSETIKRYPKAWQAHCERLSDYFQYGKDAWWTTTTKEGDVRMLDGPSHQDSQPCGPEMLHFRNATLTTVDSLLYDSWQKCLRENITIPLNKIYIYTEDRERNLTTIKYTDFLATPPSASGAYPEDTTVGSDTDLTEERDTSTDDPNEEVERTIDLAEDGDTTDQTEPVEQVRESDYLQTLPFLEDHGTVHSVSEQAVSASQESSLPVILEKENTPCENSVAAASSKTPQRKDRKGQTEPLKLFQSAQPPAFTRGEASSLTEDHPPSLMTRVSTEGKQSSWSRNLRHLLGNIDEVETFDVLRKKMKEKHISKNTKADYDRSIALLQAKLSKYHSSLNMDMKEWERDFMCQNNCSCPTLDDAPAHIKEIIQRIKLARALMRAFGMKGF